MLSPVLIKSQELYGKKAKITSGKVALSQFPKLVPSEQISTGYEHMCHEKSVSC